MSDTTHHCVAEVDHAVYLLDMVTQCAIDSSPFSESMALSSDRATCVEPLSKQTFNTSGLADEDVEATHVRRSRQVHSFSSVA